MPIVQRRRTELHPSRWSLRVRSAAAAGVVVAAALVLGAAALLWLLHRTLTGAVDAAASGRADDIVRQLAADRPADLDTALFATDSRISVAQVVGPPSMLASVEVLRSMRTTTALG